ncbi:hypothetical protein ABZ858_19930 [Streptomyces sp. NPDC047017]|uniref:hypothetical protein n=1 Tax=Streptomyces sp. NPDC047017 TaxID=3155024 RepID=UPI0033CF9593
MNGVTDRLSDLAAHTGWATFHHAAGAWIDNSSQSLATHLRQAVDDLRSLSVTARSPSPPSTA